jgi:ribonuclease HI
MSSDEVIRVYTDGACQGNPGPGGWGWAVEGGGPYASGCEKASTNQRMEVWAAFDAITTLLADTRPTQRLIRVVSDSTYVVNCFNNNWYRGWLARGWKNSQKQPVANQDLWKPFIQCYLQHPGQVTFEWVKGHSGNPMNDRVDELAVAAAASQAGRILVDPDGWFGTAPETTVPTDTPEPRNEAPENRSKQESLF